MQSLLKRPLTAGSSYPQWAEFTLRGPLTRGSSPVEFAGV